MSTLPALLRARTRTLSWRLSLLGLLCWLGFLCWHGTGLLVPDELDGPPLSGLPWAHTLLLLPPLVLLPLALSLLLGAGDSPRADRLLLMAQAAQFPAALSLLIAYLQPQGWLAGLLGLPWLAFTGLLAVAGLLRLRQRQLNDLAGPCLDVALIFLVVGGGWVGLDRLGIRPLGFLPAIVLLTAIHFHHAGFLLPLCTGLASKKSPGPAAWLAVTGVILGVPLIAIGITATQLGLTPHLETLAALELTLAGLLVAGLHLRLACWPGPRLSRGLWLLAALALTSGMVLAALYGLRHVFDLEWLDIPLMRLLHGSANALGFGLAGTLAFWVDAGSVREG